MLLNPLSFVEEQDAAWFAANIPFFECPDESLQKVYYFRWQVFKKHIRETPDGYVITEFLPPVPWAGKYNTISCASGHHFYEGRWLHNQQYLDDYALFWFRKGGEPRKYSFWAADSLYARYLVTGDSRLLLELLPDLISNYEAWEAEKKDDNGLFWQYDGYDGMEFSIGGSGYRPTINSYMYGDARAIAKTAALARSNDVAHRYLLKARILKELVQQLLWDSEAQFFKVRLNRQGLAYTHNLPESWVRQMEGDQLEEGQLADVCELIGYVPWYFLLPDEGYEAAWKYIKEPLYFAAPFGPATAEQGHRFYGLKDSHECLWNGPSWPFATSQTLTAMANLIHNYEKSVITIEDYYNLLRMYANSHQIRLEDGKAVMWIDENLDPCTGEWIARKILHKRNDPNKDRGRDYNHSSYCDLIISGLIGIKPRNDHYLDIRPLIPASLWDYFCLENVPYHNRKITILYDRTGTRYGRGTGLRIYVNDIEKACFPDIQKVLIPI
ncbi:MGH1-like glycoside hydrolase domain-containing protein [Cohnella silvisoli]|uniref:Mannosylglycerate hydrolase MGH1-like glycoside hydrolase domain-containing protein n=1 Tax=Cohnella silvisoli TaxID=2873699 RepID=A0ABV1KN61_9BACL|nr:hypothetical protein [Cohnella silvisoli]MCD9020773.1 hypothetical protein [Cohnella silvisoli]